jgi:hypothetical protein
MLVLQKGVRDSKTLDAKKIVEVIALVSVLEG